VWRSFSKEGVTRVLINKVKIPLGSVKHDGVEIAGCAENFKTVVGVSRSVQKKLKSTSKSTIKLSNI
jgi:hypothetical protein